MRRWARSEALPILAASAASRRCQVQGGPRPGQGDRQAGSQETRRRRGADRPQPQLLAGDAGDGPGDPLVAATRVALHAANGEIDQARRYSNVATFFDARKSASSRLLGEFRAMMGIFYKDVESRIQAGIALNDKGRLAEAMATYDGVLKDYPGSAWAHYERFQTRMAMATKEGKPIDQALADWPKTRDAILACDPLYEMHGPGRGRRRRSFA